MSCTLRETQLGEELEKKGDWDGAVAAYREAARKEPYNKELEEKLKTVKIRAAEHHFTLGRKMLKEQQIAVALQEFQLALGLDPEKTEYHAALNDVWRLKTARQTLFDAKHMEGLGRYDEALTLYESAVELDPSLSEGVEGITRVVQLQKATQAIGGSAEPVTLRFQNTRLKQVFEILARTANIDILFDKDVRDDLVTIFTKDTPFDEALNLILTTNQLFAKRVGPDRLLVIPDTKQKREQFDDLQIRTFYLSNAKAKDIANLLRTILETKRVYVNEPLNTVVIRDEPDKISLAEQIILANDRQDSEVLFDIEVLEVNRTRSRTVGLSFAKQAGFGVFPGTDPTSFSTDPQTFTFKNLTDIGQGSYLLRFPSSVLLNFLKQESDAKTLSNPKLRVLNNQKASINVGDKQPILLSTTNVLPGQAATGAVPTTSTVTSIEFKDTGIKVTVEPTIHLNNAITLRLQIEVTRLGTREILQATPLITQFRFGTRTADTALNMRDGETVILGGLISEEDSRTRESVPGIDDIPGLGSLLSNNKTDKNTTEVILVITPHIVRSVQPTQLAKQTLWSGTANQYSTKPMFSQPKPEVSLLTTPDSNAGLSDSVEPSAFPQKPSVTEGETYPSTSAPPGWAMASQQPADGPRLQILPTATSVKVGEQISLTIQGEEFSAFGKTSLTLTYDPAILSFSQAAEGTFWSSQQTSPSLTVSAVPHLGQLVLQMGQQGIGIQGSGSLATVVFEATGPGNSNIHIQDSTVLGPNGQSIPVNMQHGRILVE
ncbi:MAG TPA: cohesin domain-containing protein [Nitrospirales bacterium]|nr:cohesin domain-containing protein [Nitrospirales bacterium]